MPRTSKDAADAPAPPTEVGEAETPKDAEGLTKEINRGVARALKCATTPKEITEAVKAATGWYQVRYGSEEDEDRGSAFTEPRSNGHGG